MKYTHKETAISAYASIFRNVPGNEDWVGSFYECLTEHGVWDRDAFWALHIELVIAAKSHQNTALDRELAFAVVSVGIKVLNLICAHLNSADGFKIKNIDEEEIFEFKERLELAIVGVFSGEVVPESAFHVANPLMKNDV